MTNINASASLFVNSGAQYKAQASDRYSAQIRNAVNEAKIAVKPYTIDPVPADPLSSRDQRGVKDATIRGGLLDSKTAYAITAGGTFFKLVADTTVKAGQVPPLTPEPPPIDEIMTERSAMPTKARPVTTEPVTPAPIDEVAEQPPVKAPPGGIWTPYDDAPTVEAPYDGGFVITMGPDGTAICGPGPSGPVKWPPVTEAEEM